jgi:hypothetical protein
VVVVAAVVQSVVCGCCSDGAIAAAAEAAAGLNDEIRASISMLFVCRASWSCACCLSSFLLKFAELRLLSG